MANGLQLQVALGLALFGILRGKVAALLQHCLEQIDKFVAKCDFAIELCKLKVMRPLRHAMKDRRDCQQEKYLRID